jgi:protein-S-isoprenylcysteine O-methyltransferase Ste14
VPLRRLDQHDWLVGLGAFFFRTRDFVFPLVLIALALLTTPKPFLGRPESDWMLDGLGILVAFSGLLLRAVVIGLKYIHRGGKDKKVHADDLVQDGIFAHCRNPLYVGNMMIAAGILILHNDPVAYVGGLVFFAIAYLAIVAAEERYLRNRFGAEYEAYCRLVPRFALRLKGLRATLGSTEFDWRRVVRKDYGTIFTTASLAVLLVVRERVEWDGWPAGKSAVVAGCLVEAVLAALWLTAWGLKKKTGALRSWKPGERHG